jgi:glycine/D-amino acid oxidase-like deaminating enzyme
LVFVGEQTDSMSITNQIQEQLISILQTNILPDQSFEIAYQWAGTMGVGPSKKPIIKRLNKHLVVGVRMGGMGVAIGTLVGQKLSNLVLNA